MKLALVTPYLGTKGGIQAVLRLTLRSIRETDLEVIHLEMLPSRARFRHLRFGWRTFRVILQNPNSVWCGHVNLTSVARAVTFGRTTARRGLLVYGRELETSSQHLARRFAFFDTIVAISHHTSDLAINAGADPAKVRVMPLGLIDDSPATSPRPRIASQNLEVLVVSRLESGSERKNVDRALESIARLKAEGFPISLTVVGDGDDRDRLESLATELNVSEAVRFVGAVSDLERNELYNASHVLCFLSEQEGFGLVVVEAWRAGLAVVAADVGALAEICEHDRTAVLVKPNVEAVVSALADLFANEPKRVQLALSGQHMAETLYSHPSLITRLNETLSASNISQTKVDVLRLIPEFSSEYGGPAVALRSMTDELTARGHVSHIVANGSAHKPLRVNPPSSVEIVRGGITRWQIGSQSWRRIRDYTPACIVVHGVWGSHLAVGRRLARRTGAPLFVYTHGMLDKYFLSPRSISSIAKLLLYRTTVNRSLKAASRVLLTSQQELERIGLPFLTGWRHAVVKYGVEPIGGEAVNPEGVPNKYLLFLSRVHPKKRLDLLIRAFSEIERADLGLVIAGTGEEEYISKLRLLAQELGVTERVCWFGMAQGNEKASLLQNADAFVLPSEQENFGVAVAEALSAGCPVVVSRFVALAEVVTMGRAGSACDLSVSSLRAAINEVLAQPRSEVSAHARRAYDSYCSNAAAADDFLRVAGLDTGHP